MIVEEITIEEEYRKNSEHLKKSDLQLLDTWTKEQLFLPQISELELILFLHSCYYDLEKTKSTIKNYYTLRTKWAEFFTHRQNTNILQLMDVILYAILAEMTPDGYKVLICKLVVTDVNKFSFVEGLKLFCMVCDVWLREEGTANGHVIVCDMSGATIKHATKVEIKPMRKIITYLQEALPLRLKGLHFVNILPFMDKIFGLVKSFMSKELKDMLFVHLNLNDLYGHIPQNILPENLGGKSDNYEILQEKMKIRILRNNDWFENDEKCCRINKLKET